MRSSRQTAAGSPTGLSVTPTSSVIATRMTAGLNRSPRTGASHPAWSPDLGRLFYYPGPGQLTAVSVSFGPPVRFATGQTGDATSLSDDVHPQRPRLRSVTERVVCPARRLPRIPRPHRCRIPHRRELVRRDSRQTRASERPMTSTSRCGPFSEWRRARVTRRCAR